MKKRRLLSPCRRRLLRRPPALPSAAAPAKKRVVPAAKPKPAPKAAAAKEKKAATAKAKPKAKAAHRLLSSAPPPAAACHRRLLCHPPETPALPPATAVCCVVHQRRPRCRLPLPATNRHRVSGVAGSAAVDHQCIHRQLPLHHHYLQSPSKKSIFYHGLHLRFVFGPAFASISRYSYEPEESGSRAYDPELRRVLELATDSELYEIERILFGPSYFSPLLKSVLKRDEVDHFMIGEDPDEREDYISMLESRFLFLAADARSTLRGWRPSYRSVLLEVRKKLKIPCSAKLSAEDLEVEIFLYLLQEYSSEEKGSFSSSKISSENDAPNSLELGLSQWKVQQLTALGIGATDIRSLILKGGGMLTMEKILELLGGRFSGKLFTEAAKYQMKKELIKKGGQLAALNLESGAALLAARQGLKAAAVRYLGLKSVTQLFGPLMWGTLLADVFIQMLGTDYARILRAIYALAQIRIYRSTLDSS